MVLGFQHIVQDRFLWPHQESSSGQDIQESEMLYINWGGQTVFPRMVWRACCNIYLHMERTENLHFKERRFISIYGFHQWLVGSDAETLWSKNMTESSDSIHGGQETEKKWKKGTRDKKIPLQACRKRPTSCSATSSPYSIFNSYTVHSTFSKRLICWWSNHLPKALCLKIKDGGGSCSDLNHNREQ